MPELLNDGIADHIAEQAIAEVAKGAVLAAVERRLEGLLPTEAHFERKTLAIVAARDVAAAIRAGYAAYHGTREEADGE